MVENKSVKKAVLLTGGFDPLHVGHLDMLKHAARYDGKVIVGLNSDHWLLQKKGYRFMPWGERAAILLATKYVDEVFAFDDSDGTAIEAVRYTATYFDEAYFANGGDRTTENVPEQEICEELGVEMLWGIGGDHKPQSSSWLVKEVLKQRNLFEPVVEIIRLVRENWGDEELDIIIGRYIRENLL